MSVAFLNPLFWLGALALAAPLWLHLRRRFEGRVVRFSALRFLDDQPSPQSSPLRLRDLPLLALRALAILLLVAAFAWPYRTTPGPLLATESRVYVLDNTLSHRANRGFDRARDRLRSEVARAAREVQVAVVELTTRPRVVVGFGDGREAADRVLAALEPSFQRGSYRDALGMAETLLSHSLGRRKRLVVLGDNQENQWSEAASGRPSFDGVEVELPEVRGPSAPNLAVSGLRVRRTFLGDRSLVDLDFDLHHQGGARVAVVTMKVEGQDPLRREVDLAGQPEDLTLSARWEADAARGLRGEVRVAGEPDVLEEDNRAVFALPPVRAGKVVLLARSPYLRTALSPDIMRGRWATRVIEPSDLDPGRGEQREETGTGSSALDQGRGEQREETGTGTAALDQGRGKQREETGTGTSAALRSQSPFLPGAWDGRGSDDADVLCLEAHYLQSARARDLLIGHLNSGRGVLLLVDRVTPIIRGVLRSIGFETRGPDQGLAQATTFRYVYTEHPIFHPFLSPEYGNLMEVRIFRHQVLEAPRAVPLAFSQEGVPLFFQGTATKGRLFVAAFGLDRPETDWPLHPTFIPFLDLCLQNARAEDPLPTEFEPGEHAVMTLPGTVAVGEVVLRDGDRALARAPVRDGRVELKLPDRPGLYALDLGGGPEAARIVSVNPSPLESRLTYVPASEVLGAWGSGPSGARARAGSAAEPEIEMSLARIWQQRLWWWLLLGGLAALAGEMAWTSARKERS